MFRNGERIHNDDTIQIVEESIDLSWTLQRNDHNRARRYGTRMTLPLTQVGYGYTAMEDRTEIRDVGLRKITPKENIIQAMVASFFYNPTLVCGVFLFIILQLLKYFNISFDESRNVSIRMRHVFLIRLLFSDTEIIPKFVESQPFSLF